MRILTIHESSWFNVRSSEVWRRVLSLEEWPTWNPRIQAARWRGKRGWKEGHRFQLSYPRRARPFLSGGVISLVEPHREVRWLGRFLAFTVEFRLEVEPEGSGTRVSFKSGFQGLAARFASGDSILRWLTSFQRQFLASLREACEMVGERRL